DGRYQRHRAGATNCQHKVRDDRADGFQRLADPDAGDHREGVRYLPDDPGVAGGVRVGLGQGGDVAVRRALESVGREDQHEIDAEPLPVDVAQIADFGGDVAAEHVDDDLVAYSEPQPVG